MTPVRIGDIERDQAVSALGDHFAAGRLTREEFDERADEAMRARYDADLAPLFADLPRPATLVPPVRRPAPGWAGGPPPALVVLAPVLLVAAVAGAVLVHAPFLLWILVWMAVMGKVFGHRRQWRQHELHRHESGQQAVNPPFRRPGRW